MLIFLYFSSFLSYILTFLKEAENGIILRHEMASIDYPWYIFEKIKNLSEFEYLNWPVDGSLKKENF